VASRGRGPTPAPRYGVRMPLDRAPTIRDVADRAGVSYQTVSRVLNDSPQLRPRTRERVLAAIEDLGFRPSAAARALASSRSGLIGILAAESHSFYGTAMATAAIEQAARDAGYRVPVVNAAPDAESLADGLAHLQRESVEAIVVLAPQERALAAIESLAIGVPSVILGATGRGADPRLLVDQAAGARLAAEHLLRLGHTRIAHLAGPQHWVEAQARLDGFTAGMEAADLVPAAVAAGDWSAESGYPDRRRRRQRSDGARTAARVHRPRRARARGPQRRRLRRRPGGGALSAAAHDDPAGLRGGRPPHDRRRAGRAARRDGRRRPAGGTRARGARLGAGASGRRLTGPAGLRSLADPEPFRLR
jgi:DNA-binding LacI/PurR family transcriptional regulator